MAQNIPSVKRGIYNVDRFTASQASIYIGDVFIDEAYGLEFDASQNKKPIYGYSSRYFDQMTEGKFLVQGALTIHFKEAGYLWLVLNHVKGQSESNINPFTDSGLTRRYNIEQIRNGELSNTAKKKVLEDLTAQMGTDSSNPFAIENPKDPRQNMESLLNTATAANFLGFPSVARATGQIGVAENEFEEFEDAIWRNDQDTLDYKHRRCDDPILGGFDIFLTFGDFNGDNSVNHTIQKLSDVHILGQSKVIECNGEPILEVYSFVARNLV